MVKVKSNTKIITYNKIVILEESFPNGVFLVQNRKSEHHQRILLTRVIVQPWSKDLEKNQKGKAD